MNVRQQRLASEFKRMRALVGPYSLFTFQCADMTHQEAAEFLKSQQSFQMISEALPNHLDADQYQERYPNSAPDKYLIIYSCTGLLKHHNEEVKESDKHAMSVIFGYDFPASPPKLIWYTPIWHPNFDTPYVCTQGRPFAASVQLDRIVRMVGEMVQYRSYNLDSVLNYEAKEWTEKNKHLLPVDDRDIVDSRLRYKTQASAMSRSVEPLVELVDADLTGTKAIDGLLELVD
jgi:ubiquitin-protein ligase